CQGIDQFAVAHHEAHAPASHVIAFAHGEEFDRYIARTLDLHDGRRHIAVEGDVGICQIMNYKNIVFFGQRHHPLEERQIDTLRGRIAGEAQNHHLWLGNAFAYRPLDFIKEIHPWHHGNRTDVGSGNDGTIDMNGIAGIRHQDGVTTIERSKHQMRKAFLGAYGDNCLGVRIKLHVVPAFVPAGNCTPQTWNTLGYRIAMRVLTAGHLDELVNDMLGRRAVRIAHRHVNDVLAATARRHFELARNIEDIGRQALYARKIRHDGVLEAEKESRASTK